MNFFLESAWQIIDVPRSVNLKFDKWDLSFPCPEIHVMKSLQNHLIQIGERIGETSAGHGQKEGEILLDKEVSKRNGDKITRPTGAHVDSGQSHVTATPSDPGAVPMSQSRINQTPACRRRRSIRRPLSLLPWHIIRRFSFVPGNDHMMGTSVSHLLVNCTHAAKAMQASDNLHLDS
jgi:hypothetical protein